MLEPRTEVCRIERLRVHMRQKYMFETVSLPSHLFPRLAQRGFAASRLNKIASVYGLLIGDCVETVEPQIASPAALGALGITTGYPCTCA